MAAADVVFNIGTVGAKAAMLDITNVTNKIKDLGKVIREAVDSSQKFQQVADALTTDLSGFDAATGGLIDTLGGMEQANKMVTAGVKFTSEQYKILGQKAVVVARETGQDINTVFNSITKEISKGGGRFLKQIGIDMQSLVSTTAPLADRQRIALEQVTAGFEDMGITADTVNEKMFAFHNTLGTLADQMVAPAFDSFLDWVGDADSGVGSLQLSLDFLSESIASSDGALADWMVTAEGFAHVVGGIWQQMKEDSDLLGFLFGTDGISSDLSAEQLGTKIRELNKRTKQDRKKKRQDREDKQDKVRDARKFNQKYGSVVGFGSSVDTFDSGGGGGGGKAATPSDEMQAELERAEKAQVAAQEKLERSHFDFIDDLLTGDKENFDARSAEFGEFLENEQVMRAEREVEIKREAAEEIMRINEEMLQAERRKSEQEFAIQQQRMQRTAGLMGKWAGAVDTQSKAGFNAAKAMRLAEVAVTTPMAAMEGYRWGLQYGGPAGPILAAFMASEAVAFGLFQASQIAKTQFGGGRSAGGGSISNVSNTTNNFSDGTSGFGASNSPTDIVDRRPINIIVDSRTITDVVIEESIRRSQSNDTGLMVNTG